METIGINELNGLIESIEGDFIIHIEISEDDGGDVDEEE